MADTPRNRAALQALMANNTGHDMSLQDDRDFLVSVFGAWTSYSPAVTGWAATPTVEAYYYRTGNLVHLQFTVSGTSDANTVVIPLPFTPINTGSPYWYAPVHGVDSGSVLATPAKARIYHNNANMSIFKDWAESVWTTSGTKSVQGYAHYIAADL